jgi:hypothetical protein
VVFHSGVQALVLQHLRLAVSLLAVELPALQRLRPVVSLLVMPLHPNLLLLRLLVSALVALCLRLLLVVVMEKLHLLQVSEGLP